MDSAITSIFKQIFSVLFFYWWNKVYFFSLGILHLPDDLGSICRTKCYFNNTKNAMKLFHLSKNFRNVNESFLMTKYITDNYIKVYGSWLMTGWITDNYIKGYDSLLMTEYKNDNYIKVYEDYSINAWNIFDKSKINFSFMNFFHKYKTLHSLEMVWSKNSFNHLKIFVSNLYKMVGNQRECSEVRHQISGA